MTFISISYNNEGIVALLAHFTNCAPHRHILSSVDILVPCQQSRNLSCGT